MNSRREKGWLRCPSDKKSGSRTFPCHPNRRAKTRLRAKNRSRSRAAPKTGTGSRVSKAPRRKAKERSPAKAEKAERAAVLEPVCSRQTGRSAIEAAAGVAVSTRANRHGHIGIRAGRCTGGGTDILSPHRWSGFRRGHLEFLGL